MEPWILEEWDTLETGSRKLVRKVYSGWVTINEGSDNRDKGEITRFKK